MEQGDKAEQTGGRNERGGSRETEGWRNGEEVEWNWRKAGDVKLGRYGKG